MDTIDIRETIIPFSLLQITNHFKRMNAGTSIEIVGTDENIISELKNLLPEASYELTIAETISAANPCFKLWLKKTKTQNIRPKENCHVSNRPERH